jgi:hypothetical protein
LNFSIHIYTYIFNFNIIKNSTLNKEEYTKSTRKKTQPIIKKSEVIKHNIKLINPRLQKKCTNDIDTTNSNFVSHDFENLKKKECIMQYPVKYLLK